MKKFLQIDFKYDNTTHRLKNEPELECNLCRHQSLHPIYSSLCASTRRTNTSYPSFPSILHMNLQVLDKAKREVEKDMAAAFLIQKSQISILIDEKSKNG